MALEAFVAYRYEMPHHFLAISVSEWSLKKDQVLSLKHLVQQDERYLSVLILHCVPLIYLVYY